MSKKRNKKRNIILRPSVSETDVWQIGGVKVINTIPDSWQYTDDLEMLFLFYQSTDELLSEVTPDTYALPLHNALSLIDEIVETYRLLKHHNSICEYYSKYIPPIIDELLQKIEDDYLLKKIFGKRLDSIVTGFNEAKNDHKYLERWVDVFNQSCGRTKYRLLYQEEIVRLITDTKDKSKLLHCIQNFYITLINVGYSQKYLYTSAKNFFNNHSVKIASKDQIKEFLKQITSIPRKYNFLILMDMENIEYLDNISDNITISQDIKKVDIIKERKELCEDDAVSELFKEYDKKKSGSREHQKIEIVRVSDEELDPYKSAIKFNVLHLNTLDYSRWNEITKQEDWNDTYNEGFKKLKKLQPKGSNDYSQFQFDLVMANPPFAGDIKENTIISRYELGKNSAGKWQNKVGRDILFIERNLNFLKPGGRMAIVLPQGRFNNSSDKSIREYIAERCRILAVVGLHGNVFKPHTGTKTSVLFVQKWDDDLCPKKDDYPIFFATMQKPSKDNSGDKIYLFDPETGLPALDKHNHLIVDHDLFQLSYMKQDGTEALLEPGVAEAFAEFAKKEGLSFFR